MVRLAPICLIISTYHFSNNHFILKIVPTSRSKLVGENVFQRTKMCFNVNEKSRGSAMFVFLWTMPEILSALL